MKRTKLTFYEKVIASWHTIRKATIISLWLIIALAHVFHNTEIILVAILTLGAIALELLYDIFLQTRSNKQVEIFPHFEGARETVLSLIKELGKTGHPIKIQYIGMTLSNVWNSLDILFNDLNRDQIKNIKIEICMLDGSWLDNHTSINKAWTNKAAQDNIDRIIDFFDSNIDDLNRKNWSLEIRKYSNMPNLHGMMVNEQYLLMGIARWEGQTMRAGNKTFMLYNNLKETVSQEYIHIFKSWFDHYWNSKTPPSPAIKLP